jgi:hypothetical protein
MDKIDLYVYDRKLPSTPFGIYNKEVSAEFFNLGRDIERHRSYQGVKKVAVGVLPKNTPVQFLWSRYDFIQLPEPGVMYTGVRISERYITGFRNHFIKVFSTYWKEREEAGKKLTSYFIEDLSELLRKTGDTDPIPPNLGPKRVAILEEKGEWLHVCIEDGAEKWVRKPSTAKQSPVVEEREPRIVYVKWPTVSLREGPGINFKALVELKKGTILSILEEQSQWLRVRLEDGQEGWVGKATILQIP